MRNEELPDYVMQEEDENGDGFVSWDEFTGPKGTKAP